MNVWVPYFLVFNNLNFHRIPHSSNKFVKVDCSKIFDLKKFCRCVTKLVVIQEVFFFKKSPSNLAIKYSNPHTSIFYFKIDNSTVKNRLPGWKFQFPKSMEKSSLISLRSKKSANWSEKMRNGCDCLCGDELTEDKFLRF